MNRIYDKLCINLMCCFSKKKKLLPFGYKILHMRMLYTNPSRDAIVLDIPGSLSEETQYLLDKASY